MRSPLIIGTRGSDLALWQANFIKRCIEDLGHACELKIIKTQGDNMQDLSPQKMEGKGFFTKEIEEALLKEETDIAVHSFKDLPTESPEGLTIAAVSKREDPSELLLISKGATHPKLKLQLKLNAVVGTSSARRKSQLLAYRPDLKLEDIRGNVPTRLQKLRDGKYDAILIANAGVERLELDLSDFIVNKLAPTEFIPAPAQGFLAIQTRSGDKELIELLSEIDNSEDRRIAELERKVLNLFQGGCQTPVGVYGTYDEEKEVFSIRVAKSGAWDKLPQTVYSESSDEKQLAERAVAKIKNIQPCRVFITREKREESYLRSVLEGNGFTLEEKALIHFTQIDFKTIPPCDWVFFSSKHAVKYFFNQQPELKDQRFACVGKATAEALRRFGKRAEFIGSDGDTRMTGKKFASLAGSATVLFPQAKGSLRSIQQQFVRKEQTVDLVVYETTKMNPKEAPDADILVFTSPSNADAWLEHHSMRKDQKAVAMGDATAHALKRNGIYAEALADTFDDAGLARAIFGASTKTER